MKNLLQKHKLTIFFILSIVIHTFLLSSTRLKELLFLSQSIDIKEEILSVTLITLKSEDIQIVDEVTSPNMLMPEKVKFLSNKNNRVTEESKARARASSNARPHKPSATDETRDMTGHFRDEHSPLVKLKVTHEEFLKMSDRLTPPESTDYLPDIDAKDKTSLNTREFIFFSYYDRIKKRVGMFWEPALEAKFRKLYFADVGLGKSDLITKLIIVLDRRGNIVKIEKMLGSGVGEVDNAAIEAFTKAAPFANPPKGILENDNTVILRWDFILRSSNNDSIGFVLSKL